MVVLSLYSGGRKDRIRCKSVRITQEMEDGWEAARKQVSAIHDHWRHGDTNLSVLLVSCYLQGFHDGRQSKGVPNVGTTETAG